MMEPSRLVPVKDGITDPHAMKQVQCKRCSHKFWVHSVAIELGLVYCSLCSAGNKGDLDAMERNLIFLQTLERRAKLEYEVLN